MIAMKEAGMICRSRHIPFTSEKLSHVLRVCTAKKKPRDVHIDVDVHESVFMYI